MYQLCMILFHKSPSVLKDQFSTERFGIYTLPPSVPKSLLNYLHSDIWDSILYSIICSSICVHALLRPKSHHDTDINKQCNRDLQ